VTLPVIEADWTAPDGVTAVVTTRRGGMSRGAYASLNLAAHVGDEPSAVADNRARLEQALALPGSPCWLEQVHGTTVQDLDTAAGTAGWQADGSVTSVPGRICAVLTADCLPVVLATTDGARVGIAHAGWRGLLAGVLENAVAAMGRPGEALRVWLGPHIGTAAYEVGEELRAAFLARDPATAGGFTPNARGRWQADLAWLARHRLRALGVADVHGGALCTYTRAETLFSHRREAPCGRFATLVWRQPR
jgi:YfiH family protein